MDRKLIHWLTKNWAELLDSTVIKLEIVGELVIQEEI